MIANKRIIGIRRFTKNVNNRIVVDYGDTEKLVLLGVIETASGREVKRENIEEHLGHSFELVKRYHFTESWDHLKAHNDPAREGYVLVYPDGFRMKVKFEEYVRLHRIITQVSTIDIWEHLKNGEPLDELVEQVPDEFFDWVRETARDLTIRYENIECDYLSYYEEIILKAGGDDRKAFAEEAKRYNHPGILFSMLDSRDYSQAIWRMIRPQWSKPFRKESL